MTLIALHSGLSCLIKLAKVALSASPRVNRPGCTGGQKNEPLKCTALCSRTITTLLVCANMSPCVFFVFTCKAFICRICSFWCDLKLSYVSSAFSSKKQVNSRILVVSEYLSRNIVKVNGPVTVKFWYSLTLQVCYAKTRRLKQKKIIWPEK